MNKPTRFILFALVLGALGGAAGLLYQNTRSGNTVNLTAPGLEQLPDFSFPDIDGNLRSSREWEGNVLIVNFWATWCPPCREEMPLFVETQQRLADRGVQFVAIAIDDEDLVRDFHDVYAINFPTLVGGMEAVKLANSLGNRFDSLPFTAIFDRNGKSRYIQAGEVKKATLEAELNKIL
ncbi:MAG: TlpA family protein disulfide reductase [Gammaproteobacteria bacterium]|nr:TlpA family protein disulfide reductase [Gammaproteobacteria bacterium]